MFSGIHKEAKKIAKANESPYYLCRCIRMLSWPWVEKKDKKEEKDQCEIHIYPNVDVYGSGVYEMVDDLMSKHPSYSPSFRDEDDYGAYIYLHVDVDSLEGLLQSYNARLAELKPSKAEVSKMSQLELLNELEVCLHREEVSAELAYQIVNELRGRLEK